jgi:hypothetical protein
MAFRPKLFNTVFHERYTLDGFPSEKGIVSDKRCAVAVTNGEFDEQVNEICEVSNLNNRKFCFILAYYGKVVLLTGIFKETVDDLHDTRCMLDDGDFVALFHLQSSQ